MALPHFVLWFVMCTLRAMGATSTPSRQQLYVHGRPPDGSNPSRSPSPSPPPPPAPPSRSRSPSPVRGVFPYYEFDDSVPSRNLFRLPSPSLLTAMAEGASSSHLTMLYRSGFFRQPTQPSQHHSVTNIMHDVDHTLPQESEAVQSAPLHQQPPLPRQYMYQQDEHQHPHQQQHQQQQQQQAHLQPSRQRGQDQLTSRQPSTATQAATAAAATILPATEAIRPVLDIRTHSPSALPPPSQATVYRTHATSHSSTSSSSSSSPSPYSNYNHSRHPPSSTSCSSGLASAFSGECSDGAGGGQQRPHHEWNCPLHRPAPQVPPQRSPHQHGQPESGNHCHPRSASSHQQQQRQPPPAQSVPFPQLYSGAAPHRAADSSAMPFNTRPVRDPVARPVNSINMGSSGKEEVVNEKQQSHQHQRPFEQKEREEKVATMDNGATRTAGYTSHRHHPVEESRRRARSPPILAPLTSGARAYRKRVRRDRSHSDSSSCSTSSDSSSTGLSRENSPPPDDDHASLPSAPVAAAVPRRRERRVFWGRGWVHAPMSRDWPFPVPKNMPFIYRHTLRTGLMSFEGYGYEHECERCRRKPLGSHISNAKAHFATQKHDNHDPLFVSYDSNTGEYEWYYATERPTQRNDRDGQ